MTLRVELPDQQQRRAEVEEALEDEADEPSLGRVSRGDVYFVGSLDGMVRAYDAETGKKVWTSEAHGPVSSSLWVEEDTLLWGTGVPERFGGAKDG